MKSTILIVDDSRLNREILSDLFKEEHQILKAADGGEALAVLEERKQEIDVVILDLLMPKMSGLEVLKKREEISYFKDIPVVVITGSDAMEDQVKAFALGASDFITKPFVSEIVISRVNNVLASRKRMVLIAEEAAKMKIKSELDQMTGLLNKPTTEAVSNERLKLADGKLHALLVIDIDNFKSVNDLRGHQAGDHVIKIIADFLSSLFRKSDIVGRVGGDEFLVMMVDIPDMDIARMKVREIIQLMKYKPNLTIDDNISLSIGVAANNREIMTYQELFDKADQALYQAKKAGKACFREYGVEFHQTETDDRQMALLFSRNRNVSSTISALLPDTIRIEECKTMEDLSRISRENIEKLIIVYMDVTDQGEDPDFFGEKVESFSWIKEKKIIAICREGNLQQYLSAIVHHVVDVIPEPIEKYFFKRRTNAQLYPGNATAIGENLQGEEK
ncbi:MAG: diguanylate cyclase [Lachnospiraceae bacterium]|nr:diguanylate cyclase [Lachnospiraceae bacterium]